MRKKKEEDISEITDIFFKKGEEEKI